MHYRNKASTFTLSIATTIRMQWLNLKPCVKATSTSSFLRYGTLFSQLRISKPELPSCNGAVRVALEGKIFKLNAVSTVKSSLI